MGQRGTDEQSVFCVASHKGHVTSQWLHIMVDHLHCHYYYFLNQSNSIGAMGSFLLVSNT